MLIIVKCMIIVFLSDSTCLEEKGILMCYNSFSSGPIMHSVPSNMHQNLSRSKPLKMKMMKMITRMKMKKPTVNLIATTWRMMMTILVSRFFPSLYAQSKYDCYSYGYPLSLIPLQAKASIGGSTSIDEGNAICVIKRGKKLRQKKRAQIEQIIASESQPF